MNVLSLFDGMSCGQIALNRADIKYDNYFASEIDQSAINVTQHNFPKTIQIGDVTKVKGRELPKIDLLIGGSPCFTKDVTIITENGIIPISDIKVGDVVLTHKLNWKRVIDIGNQLSNTIKIKAQGIFETETTTEHPYYVKSMSRVWDKSKRTKVRNFSEAKWKPAGELSKGDFIANPIIKDEIEYKNLSEDECFVIGRYIADGHTRKDKKHVNSRCYQLILSIGNKKYFNTDLKYSLCGYSKNVDRMIFSSKRLVEIVEKNCGCDAENKHISMDLLKLPKNKLEKIIDGILSGDGSKRNEEYRVTTVSKKLAQTLSLAINKVYKVAANVEFTKRPPKTIIEGRIVNQRDTYTVSFRKEIKKQSNFHTDENFIWCPFKIACDGEINQVYNLTVEDDNSYVANNAIVHNCQGFSTQGNQLNFEDPRSKLFFEFVRLLEECKPKYFFLENVKMKKEYEKVISQYLKVEPIEINSALLSAQRRKRLYWTNIPNITQPKDKGLVLKDIMEDEVDEKHYCSEKCSIRIESKKYSLSSGNDINKKCQTLMAGFGMGGTKPFVKQNGRWRKLTPVECERLQTVDDNYTAIESDSQRYKMLGNGWTVDVIAHIFKNINQVQNHLF